MEPIITAQTILSALLTLTTTNVDSVDFCYNADFKDNKVSAIDIYDNDGNMLTAKIRRQYTYDDQDRLLTREMQKWNAKKHQWQPVDCLFYTYTPTGMTIELKRWDNGTGEYSKPVEQTRYDYYTANVTAVERSKWNARKEAYQSQEKVLMMNPSADYDLAYGK